MKNTIKKQITMNFKMRDWHTFNVGYRLEAIDNKSHEYSINGLYRGYAIGNGEFYLRIANDGLHFPSKIR